MKKKPDPQDFFINSYPVSAYPNPWDFVVDGYDLRSRSRRLWIKDEVYAELVKTLFDGGNCNTILDVGCGAGTLSLLLADDFMVHSLDFSKSMLERLKTRTNELKKDVLALVNADNQKIPFKTNSFDGTLCKFALWPVPNPKETIKEMIRVTRPNGRIIIIEVNRTNGYGRTFRSKFVYGAYRGLKKFHRRWKRQNNSEAWKVITETTKNNPKINLKYTKEVLESCGCEITAVDTSVKTKINGFFGKISGGQCGEHGYFLVCAEKR